MFGELSCALSELQKDGYTAHQILGVLQNVEHNYNHHHQSLSAELRDCKTEGKPLRLDRGRIIQLVRKAGTPAELPQGREKCICGW